MNESSPRCPDCGAGAACLGAIPATDIFAGKRLAAPIDGGALYRCHYCLLGFKWPRPSKSELDRLYACGSDFTWTATSATRRDWNTVQGWIRQKLAPGSRLLDVGCFDGGFLGPLATTYRCSGVEIHPEAGNRAVEKGVELLGDDFSAVSGRFDLVTAFDVIEHVERPGEFLRDCLRATRPDGYVLISSGNLDARSFRFMGSRYWYCAIGEHISFISPAWFDARSRALQYRILWMTNFIHGDARLSRRVYKTLLNLGYRYCNPVFRKLRELGAGGKNTKDHPQLADHPPSWISAKDHVMVLLQKQGE